MTTTTTTQKPESLTIGKLARAAGVGVETVRFYERKGLLKQPKKKAGSFRHYPAEDAAKIRFIRRAQELGFTLREIRGFLAMNAARNASCGDVAARVSEKVAEVEAKIRDLEKMKTGLLALRSACGQGQEAMACARIADCFEGRC